MMHSAPNGLKKTHTHTQHPSASPTHAMVDPHHVSFSGAADLRSPIPLPKQMNLEEQQKFYRTQ